MMLEGLEPPKPKFTCKIELLLTDLEKKDAEILQAAIDDVRKWPAKSLQKALKERGLSLADTVISRHRAKICRCYKD